MIIKPAGTSTSSFLFSLSLHALIIIFLLFQLPFSSFRLPSDGKNMQIVKAVMIDANTLKRQERASDVPTPAPIVNKPLPLQKPQTQAPKTQPVAIQKQAQQAQLKMQQQLQKQQQLKKQQEQQAARNHQRQLLLQKQKALQEQLFSQELASEQKQLSQIHNEMETEQNQGIIDQYKAQIIAAIEEQWAIPSDADKNLVCQLSVRMAPNGVVLGVSLVKSSGNLALDRSAQAAVYKASPLPVPKDPALFASFRELHINVSPKTILN